MSHFKLAELLLRRKELQNKVDQIAQIKKQDVYEIKAKRVKITDSIDDIAAEVPRLNLSQVTAEYDFYSKALRNVDAAIQQCNWTTEVELLPVFMNNYDEVKPILSLP